MKMNKRKILLLLFFLSFFACKSKQEDEHKFDKVKWSTKSDSDYPYRDKMLKDLIDNVKLKGLKWNEVTYLLGQPDRTDSSYLFYRIKQKRIGFFPLSTKTLIIKLAKDSTVEWRKIHG